MTDDQLIDSTMKDFSEIGNTDVARRRLQTTTELVCMAINVASLAAVLKHSLDMSIDGDGNEIPVVEDIAYSYHALATLANDLGDKLSKLFE